METRMSSIEARMGELASMLQDFIAMMTPRPPPPLSTDGAMTNQVPTAIPNTPSIVVI